MALPGSVLPALLAQWSLADSQAGLLFFLGWLGSSLGALLVRGSLVRSLILGSSLLTVSSFGMAFGSRTSCFAWMAIFGAGLGATMTSISLIQAARNAERRGMELNRLNLFWALGACTCPSLAAHSLKVANIRGIFSAVGILFASLLLWTIAMEGDLPSPQSATRKSSGQAVQTGPAQWFTTLTRWPLLIILIMFLPTGVESAVGGWIAAYVQRTQETIATTVTAGSCFWIGMLCSRTLNSTFLLLRRSERFVLGQSMVTIVFGMALLLISKTSVGILPAVFLTGFGLGPVYPLLLAQALQYSDNTLIFFIAGLGSSFLPWLTGVVSTSASSLRTGLLVPFAGSVLMLLLGIRLLAKPVRQPFKPSAQ